MEKLLEQHKLEPSTICQHCKHNHADNPDEGLNSNRLKKSRECAVVRLHNSSNYLLDLI